jgi:cobalamin biosynthesis protein CobT
MIIIQDSSQNVILKFNAPRAEHLACNPSNLFLCRLRRSVRESECRSEVVLIAITGYDTGARHYSSL